MTHPAVGTGEVYRLIDWTVEARTWAAGAESWLAPLREPEPGDRPSSASRNKLQPGGRGR
jgi:hypothetical protein